MYCMQSRLRTCPKSESSINAGGCSFNSFLRRTVRFVGTHDPPRIWFLYTYYIISLKDSQELGLQYRLASNGKKKRSAQINCFRLIK